jgi:hypothetical protein
MELREKIENIIRWIPEVRDNKLIVDRILALPELKEMMEKVTEMETYLAMTYDEVREQREKAEKYDKYHCCEECSYRSVAKKWEEEALRYCKNAYFWRDKLDIILSCLVSEGECPVKHEGKFYNGLFYAKYGDMDRCSICHGTGKESRPATAEEVREVIVAMIKGRIKWIDLDDKGWGVRLSNDRVLRMEGK